MSGDDEVEWARSVARLFRGLYEDSVIEAAEAALPLTDDAGIPMPETAHPAYASNAGAVRSLMDDGRSAIRVARVHRPAFSYSDGDKPLGPTEPLRALTLAVKKCAGPAPFVGDPRVTRAMYVWRAAVDDAGRHIAGPATLEWATPTPPPPTGGSVAS